MCQWALATACVPRYQPLQSLQPLLAQHPLLGLPLFVHRGRTRLPSPDTIPYVASESGQQRSAYTVIDQHDCCGTAAKNTHLLTSPDVVGVVTAALPRLLLFCSGRQSAFMTYRIGGAALLFMLGAVVTRTWLRPPIDRWHAAHLVAQGVFGIWVVQ